MFRNLFDNPVALLLLVLLIVILFGASKLPNAARQMGRSARIFKSEIKEMKNDDAEHPQGSRASSEPLEGRVVDDHVAPTAPPTPTPTPRAGDAERRDA